MFAFALWDDAEKTLHLARDRFGEKPLYFGWCNSTFLFGSELKALAAHPHFRGEINRAALEDFLHLGYVPAPRSIFRGIGKLEPGTFVSLDTASRARCATPEPVAYWSARDAARRSLAAPFKGTDLEAIDALDAALRKAVSLRTFADVPVGAFLSGGIDSSTIVAVMQATSSETVQTFTIGNTDAAYDESRYSAAVARHLGTRHEVRIVTRRDALDIIPQLPDYYCEPFADSSQIPTILVARTARAHVKVALSGDGGDELFGGYNRHVSSRKTAAWAARLPSPLRALIGAALAGPSAASWETLLRGAGGLLPSLQGRRITPTHIRTLAKILRGAPGRQVYDGLVSAWPHEAAPVLGDFGSTDNCARDAMPDLLREMMYIDTVTYLPDDILVKVDRATMGESLEGRAPFLDPDLFALAWSLPINLVTDGQRGKLALRQVLARYVPAHLFERPKQGFAIPIGAWLRDDLAGWAESLLDESSLRADGYLDAGAIRALWRSHKSGAPGCERALWHVLMFQSWLQRWRKTIHSFV
jgi:asparagine synthase (glutamine-hydrolysing)